MSRVVLALVLVFLALGALRAVRALAAAWLRRMSGPGRLPPREGEMARDPVCGSWFDRRLAVLGQHAGRRIEVCSEECRRALEAG